MIISGPTKIKNLDSFIGTQEQQKLAD